MSDDIEICLICLRTDRKLREIDYRLSEFHDGFCGYIINTADPQYCLECEYRLKKFYNFQNKCMLALETLLQWKKDRRTIIKKPLHLIHTILPPNSLGPWSASVHRYFYTYVEQDLPDTNNSHVDMDDKDSKIDSVHGAIQNPVNINQPIYSVSELPDAPNKVAVPELKSTSAPISVTKGNMLTLGPLTLAKRPPLTKKMKMMKDNLMKKEILGKDLPFITLKKTANKTKQTSLDKVTDKKVSDRETNNNDDINDNEIDDDIGDQEIIPDNIDEIDDKYILYEYLDEPTISPEIDDTDTKDLDPLINNDKSNIDSDIKNINTHDDLSSNVCAKIRNIYDHDYDIIINENMNVEYGIGRSKRIENDKAVTKVKRRYVKRKVLDDYESMLLPNGNVNRKRLIGKIMYILESYDVLEREGSVIDKEFLLSCLEDKVPETVWKLLWRCIQHKSHYKKKRFIPNAIKFFHQIQIQYKRDEEISSACDITYLNTEEKMLEEYNRRKERERSKQFQCSKCYQGFQCAITLEKHMKKHEESAGSFVCYLCDVRLPTKLRLMRHIHSHETVYKCKLCPMVTKYWNSMYNHVNHHTGMKYKCELCEATYEWPSYYYQHLIDKHGRNHVCTSCGQAFLTAEKLKEHETKHQEKPQSFKEDSARVQCDRCVLSFPSEKVLQRHFRVSHRLPPPKPKIQSTYTTISRANRRKRQPGEKKRQICKVCNEEGSYGWLIYHFDDKHPSVDIHSLYGSEKQHLCDICGKKYPSLWSLKDHLNVHNDVRPYACSVCPKRFHRALALRQHRLHHMPPSKTCNICNKKFRSSSNLNIHKRIHIGDRRYMCKVCDKAFLHSTSLKEHFRGVHRNERRVR